jgi:hypothetical protein
MSKRPISANYRPLSVQPQALRRSQRLIASGWRRANPHARVDINSLPDVPLATIIQHLPWRDRLLAECVNRRWRRLATAQGWAHVRDFNTFDYYNPQLRLRLKCQPRERARMLRVLDRCGAGLDSLYLTIEEAPIELLRRCPNLSRVEFRFVPVDVEMVEFLRENHASSGLRYACTHPAGY